ncbi:MAG TPA: hypothetical protein VGQ59_09635, partial [Cyclobacteriaceae bacterium]|nr:hypothetical protein [Cyclobacteriaceae bacterium]
MSNRIFKSFVVSVICLCSGNFTSAQSSDSARKEKSYKNIIKINLTSNILYRSPLIEYERIIKKNQSFSIQFGLIALPFGSSKGSDSIYYESTVKKAGYSITADYRFYLAKENKDPAPHGVYIGPYIGYYNFDNERNMRVGSSPDLLLLSSKFDVLSIGAELGYQFVLGKKERWTIDCIVVGPSLTKYSANLKLTGNIDPSKIDENVQKILEGI